MMDQETASKGTQSRETIIEVENLSVEYDTPKGVNRVVDDVDLTLERDEIISVVGESGSGKSMLASALLDAVPEPGKTKGNITYYPPDGGEPINVLEQSQNDLKRFRWEEISMVFQGAMSSFNPTMSIRGHFEETIQAHDMEISQQMERAHQILEDLHLDAERVLDSYPHELSGGMSQRALIALSLLLDPEVLVMDEPTAALDLLMQRSIIQLLAELQETYDLTILFITHDLPLIAGLADRLAVMYAFELLELGPADELITDAAHPYTRALLRSVPNLNTPIDEMTPISGMSPDPMKVPEGCSYHPRCPLAEDKCRTDDPELFSETEDHLVGCFYTNDSREQISYTVSVDENRRDKVAEPASVDRYDDADPIVSLENVEVHFEEKGLIDTLLRRDAETVFAVNGVDLDIYENDVVALVGESGCGKTTLGKTTIGLQRPSNGSVNYNDQDIWVAKDGTGKIDIAHEEIRRALQIVHQDPGESLNPNNTILSNLARPLKKYRPDMGPAKRETIIHRLLESMGIQPAEDYASRFPHQLSGGEQQRVALGRVILMQPDLVLADEAVSALDVSLRVEMMDLILELQEQFNTSYLFISHNFANARYLTKKADGRIGIMYLGNIVEIGPVDSVLKNPKHPYTKALTQGTSTLDPEEAKKTLEGDEELPIRTIDIPDAKNPPSGCNFYTRCPEVIPPEDLDIDQDTYTKIMDVRLAIEDRTLETEPVWEGLGIDSDESNRRNAATAEFVEELRNRTIDIDLPNHHQERIDTAFEHLANEDWEMAAESLREQYESVCERDEPTLDNEAHPAACHLYDVPEVSEQPTIKETSR
ncbi:peptide ABC transporter ATP-binding protein [Haloferax sp. Atlit-4N]|uniref:ABC transporter ATP-binding protein n=1 Tax=Haloferax sp. Atlit-4N TaxID=2077206 RepID=UPI000E27D097|nr:ABC transporter ATP-binding protein [Haloferax sp. Atlit-4N]RDZ51338.1 peptide ABC transporter ATP-binding protein [Haloferax sp. Atlit-4N]